MQDVAPNQQNMNYELAKQLKDAGFPQDFVECDYCRAKPGSPVLCAGCLYRRAAEPKIPTLSELIEACGDKLQVLWKRDDGWLAKSWVGHQHTDYHESLGKTPDEAVARLWLALNSTK